MKELNKNEKYLVISELASWYSPEELLELFGIKYVSIYHYCNRYGIPKYRESVSKHKQDFLNEYDNFLQTNREDSLARVKRKLGIG